ncbi:glycosyltransferase [Qipengyuania sediminis]|uniref:glycosyltransferase n=1 Tax=Qipengyuania sediminis TaxID=1532023 RepID=UPI001F0DC638|nr:glycosyltransferase family 2 protein [Qipengyuania sediminis]
MTAPSRALALTTGIVAIGRNEGERLVRCLASLRDAACPLVYVDSASTDGSPETAAAMGAVVVPLDMRRPFTAARARAEGVAALERTAPELDTVFFIDGDCELEPGFLAAATRFLAGHPDYAVACGRRRERFPEASLYNRLIDREWNTPVGDAAACGGDALYRLAAYRAVGGFDAAMLAGEEPELCARLRAQGWRIMRLDSPMTLHDAAMHRFGQWWKRALRSGMGYVQAWRGTRAGALPGLYRRNIARAATWAGALPLLSLTLALAHAPWWLLLWPGLTLLQFARLMLREGMAPAALSIAGKYAELAGMLRYLVEESRGGRRDAVSYK